jgi:hypothetical protein
VHASCLFVFTHARVVLSTQLTQLVEGRVREYIADLPTDEEDAALEELERSDREQDTCSSPLPVQVVEEEEVEEEEGAIEPLGAGEGPPYSPKRRRPTLVQPFRLATEARMERRASLRSERPLVGRLHVEVGPGKVSACVCACVGVCHTGRTAVDAKCLVSSHTALSIRFVRSLCGGATTPQS